ncbi:MAG: ribosome-associated translation inhibitor RaiA [Thermodesulfobacteriota bacterium]|nr:ribosome-associated translation inhibitor RaiA [Thermodesulfobacteriota bacterium]
MQITVTFRHVDPVDAVRDYAKEKANKKIKKYLDEPLEVDIILSIEKHRHIAEVVLNANGVDINAKGIAEDLNSSIDLVMDKIEVQLRKQKEKHLQRKHIDHALSGVATIDEFRLTQEDEKPVIIEENYSLKPMSFEEAMLQMEMIDSDFVVFVDDSSNRVNVLYKRKDGNYGLIVPS